jgi:hypothetical protein
MQLQFEAMYCVRQQQYKACPAGENWGHNLKGTCVAADSLVVRYHDEAYGPLSRGPWHVNRAGCNLRPRQ